MLHMLYDPQVCLIRDKMLIDPYSTDNIINPVIEVINVVIIGGSGIVDSQILYNIYIKYVFIYKILYST